MATPVCLLVVLATPISTLLAEIVIRSAALLVSVALFLIDWFASLSWSSEFICTPSPFEIGAFYLLLVFCVNRYDRWRDRNLPMSPRNLTWLWKLVPLFLMVFLIIDAIQISSQSRHAGTLSLTAVDVGQGSSILVRFPGGKRMLVDGGGFFDETFDIGKLVLAPFLWQQRIGTIDTVVLTHSHPDHLQGLLFILEHFGVREVWTNGRPTDSPLYSIFLEIIGRRGINLKVCSSDLPEMQFFGTKIRILNPVVRNESSLGVEGYAKGAADQLPFRPATSAPGRPLSKEDPNDLSLVIRISYGSRHFLLPGDITERTERQILQSGHTLASDVLFVPHHGGARSSHPAFLERVSPEVAIVSCGADNVFGLPQPEVLRRYAQIHCRLYRTDRDGAVTVTTDGQALTTHLFRTGQR
jgi:competence protein ComEC